MNEQEKIALPLTREALYELAWSEPMLKIAARFGVSSSYMARVCTRMNVPRPKLGYWAQREVGKVDPQPPLPDARPWDELSWNPGGGPATVARALPKPPADSPKRPRVRAPVDRSTQHALLVNMKPHFEEGRLSRDGGYLKPRKFNLPDLIVTKTGLEKALAFANAFFLSMEDKGYRVTLAPPAESYRRAEVDEREKPQQARTYSDLWLPRRATVVYIGTVAMGLSIVEVSEEVEMRYVNGKYVRVSDYVEPKRGRFAQDHSWTTKKDLPTGRLLLQAYSPYPRAEWKRQWRETGTRTLTDQINSIISGLEAAVREIVLLVQEGERQAEIEHQKWEAQRAGWDLAAKKRKAADDLKASQDQLFQIIEKWAEVNRIEQFFKDVELRATGLGGEDLASLKERLKLARDMIGGVDALSYFLAWRAPSER